MISDPKVDQTSFFALYRYERPAECIWIIKVSDTSVAGIQ